MRLVFWLLLLANVAFFAYPVVVPRPAPGEPQVMARQMNADKVRLLSESERKEPTAEAPAIQACVEWGTFGPGEAARAEAALSRLNLGGRLSRARQEEAVRYWVHMAPLPGKPEADKKAAELAALGVSEYYVVQDPGPFRYAISLGLFKTEEGARAHLARLQERGVRSAVIGERPQGLDRVRFVLREPGPEEQAALVGIKQDFPGTDLKALPCPAPGAG